MRELKCSPCKKINREYKIIIGTNILKKNLLELVLSYEPDKIIIITDSNVEKLYGEKVKNLINNQIPTSIISMPAGEKNKTPEIYFDLCDQVLQKKVTKRSFILVLGGGVPGNVGGFVASTVMRGIKFGHIPTTLIAQSDSTSGGKQGVNTKYGKNLLGLFNDPEFVIIDTEFLSTLPKREIRSGLAECIKHALCQDKEFVDYLINNLNPETEYSDEVLREILFRTLKAKLEILRRDPKEINEGKILVYGHTIGHALETISDYKLTHGEAISIGMIFVAFASQKLGISNEELVNIHQKILKKCGLPISIPEYVKKEELIKQLKYDKKYSSQMELILLNSIGNVYSHEGKFGYPINEIFIEEIFEKYF